jgi:hypothetical protein
MEEEDNRRRNAVVGLREAEPQKKPLLQRCHFKVIPL